jgi:hypothetical protein
VHVAGHVACAPSHAKGAHVGAPAVRAGLAPHVPVSGAQTSHGPSHGRSQQIPCAQWPVAQSASTVHPRPALRRHVEIAVQTSSPAQLSGSSADTTLTHLPPVPAHVSHAPVQARSQQTPSAQARVVHAASAAQASPSAAPEPTTRARMRVVPKPGEKSPSW